MYTDYKIKWLRKQQQKKTSTHKIRRTQTLKVNQKIRHASELYIEILKIRIHENMSMLQGYTSKEPICVFL